MRHVSLEYIDGLEKSIYKDFTYRPDNQNHIYEVDGISVVIPVSGTDRQRSLEFVISRLQLQRIDNYEIIVSEIDTQEKIDLHKFVNDMRIKKVFTKTEDNLFNKSTAVNRAVLHAKYNKIMMNDADIIVSNNYIYKLSELLDRYDAIFLGKQIYNIDILRSSVIYTGWVRNDYFSGGNIGFNKDVFIRIGGMCEAFRGYGSEDCEFMLRLKCATNFYEDRSESFLHIAHKRCNFYSENTKMFDNINNMTCSERIQFSQKYFVKHRV